MHIVLYKFFSLAHRFKSRADRVTIYGTPTPTSFHCIQ